jgi:hypothetical protein
MWNQIDMRPAYTMDSRRGRSITHLGLQLLGARNQCTRLRLPTTGNEPFK